MKFYINPKEAQCISALAKYKDASAASKHLDIPYNTLMQTLFRTEKRLSVNNVFFRKAHNKMEINPLYSDFVEECIKIEEINNNIDNLLTVGQTEYEFTILSSLTLIEAFFIPFLQGFLSDFGDIKINISECNDFSFDDPMSNQIVTVTQILDDKDQYTYIPFHDFTQKLWASPEYIKKEGPFNRIEDLNEKTVLFQKGRLLEKDSPHTKELIGSRGIFKHLMEKGIKLSSLDVVGVRSIDLMCEYGFAIMVASEETTKINGLHVTNILPSITGDTVTIYLKVQKKVLKGSPHIPTIINNIMETRNTQLEKVGVTPTYPFIPLRHTSNNSEECT